MSVVGQILCTVALGILSTLPLGPSGLSIVKSFASCGIRRGIYLLGALGVVEIFYLCISLTLRSRGVLELTSSVEILLTSIFGLFLLLYGVSTYRSRKSESTLKKSTFKKILFMSLMNPSLIISYLGLIILMDKSSGGYTAAPRVLLLISVFLLSVWGTLTALGLIARLNNEFLSNHMKKINAIIGPVFFCAGLTTLFSTF
ncbi:LysE family transporter [Halobacteriovorax sp. HLS]|uniref:LysE family transporter n=1 Tax=Halobacteriovorax sp. HLS TaxID=2234000 RepID=UPI000FDAA190|nr:LysE family transporter [Halobacteriovorax sp. HLS]